MTIFLRAAFFVNINLWGGPIVSQLFKFGERVEGYNIPVLNEREIRAAAGILFLFLFYSIMTVGFTGDFTLVKFAIIMFFVDFTIRVFINPRFAPTLIIGRLIVRNQVPEYVGAQQKKFAWVIGFILGLTMLVLLVIVNGHSPISGLICFFCLIFLFFESAFGICLGCKVYPWIYKEKAQYCPGEVCDINDRQEIQRTSGAQLVILMAYVVFLALAVVLLKDTLSVPPWNLLGIEGFMDAYEGN